MKKKKKPALPPLPPPAPPPPHHQYRRRPTSLSSLSSSSLSSTCSTISTLPSPSPSPSPYHHPFSSVPFSWERRPGISKFTPIHPRSPYPSLPLPLPPSKLRNPNSKQADLGELFTNKADVIGRRRGVVAIVAAVIGRLSVLDRYGTCKAAAAGDVAAEAKICCSSRRARR